MHRRLRLVRLEDRLTPSSYASLVSRADPAAPPDTPGGASDFGSPSRQSVLSDDGRYLVYQSAASNIIAGQMDLNAATDIFLYDRTANTTNLVSHAAGSSLACAAGASTTPTISGDGR